jgi:hypothetical protein
VIDLMAFSDGEEGASLQIFEGASQKIPKNSEKLRGKCGDH